VCDSIAMLYAGRVVETGPTDAVLTSPTHPYTSGLLGALPARRAPGEPLAAIPGTVPANLLGISGCAFADRCPRAIDRCRTVDPALEPVSSLHEVACIRADER
jgi:peptide/nickel transport system ATP-binding protein